MRKLAVSPRRFGISCARTQRWEVARRTTVAGSRRSRRAHSSAMTLVGSETTSVPRSAESTLFWLACPMMEQTPRGATGDSSIDSKRGGCCQQMPIDFDEAPLIDERRLDETVAIPLLDQIGRPAAGRARFRDLEQQRP